MSTRYFDEGFPLLHWATEIEAVCPKCKGVGVVNGKTYWRDWRAVFLCHTVSHSLKTERDKWLGPVLGMGRRPCGSCGHQWVRVEKYFDDALKVKKETSSVNCPKCNSENVVSLKLIRTEPIDYAIDPLFGLELALNESTQHGTVWAYGAKYLEQLRLYTAAQLREGDGAQWSYFTRLPKWLKISKNRELVLKAISKLEKGLIKKLSN